MGARLCRSYMDTDLSIPKRADYSIETSTASEPNSQQDYAPPHPVDASNDSRDQVSDPSLPNGDFSIVAPHRSFSRCTAACGSSCRPHLPRVSSGCLTPIEEEPPSRSDFGGRMVVAHSFSHNGRSRTRSGDSIDSSVSSFGSMKNYQRFVTSRS